MARGRPLEDARGRTAVVTGASSGLGAGLARALARRGARVALVARRRELLDRLAAEIRGAGGAAEVVVCDVASRSDVERAVAEVRDRLGPIEILVNNAGVNSHVLFKDQPIEEIERLMRVNYLGMVYWTKAALPDMRARREGWLVQVSSLAGRVGQPDEAAYAASKFAVTGLSESIAHELEPLGIHVLTVYPGAVRTEMFSPEVMSRLPPSTERGFVSVETFAERVMRALTRGAFEVTVPSGLRIAYVLRATAPGLLRHLVARIRLPWLPDLMD